MRRRLGKLAAMAGIAALGAAAQCASAITLPACVPGVTCLPYGDFNVFSLPLLNLQAGYGSVPGPGDPYFVSSTYGSIKNYTIVGINNGQSGTGNVSGSIDGAFNTPSPNNATNGTFSTLAVGTDPGGTGEFTGDNQSWDATISTLLSQNSAPPLVAYFAFNETGSGTGLLTTDLLIWASATVYDYDAQGNVLDSQTFYLGGAGAPPSLAAAGLPLVNGSDANGSGNAGTPSGFGPWVYVHAGTCVSCSTFVGFPDTSGNCAVGTVANQNNLGQNAAAFAVNSPALDAALGSGKYNVLSVTWEMAYINGGGETAWIMPTSIPSQVPEPATLALVAVGLLLLGALGRRRAL